MSGSGFWSDWDCISATIWDSPFAGSRTFPRHRTECQPAPSVHEIKHDGYRLIVRLDDNRVRLYTRRGFNGATVSR
jgi:hypothetical protein